MIIRASYSCDKCQCELTVLTAKIVPNHETMGNWLMCGKCEAEHYKEVEEGADHD